MVNTSRNEICAMHKCVTFIHKGQPDARRTPVSADFEGHQRVPRASFSISPSICRGAVPGTVSSAVPVWKLPRWTRRPPLVINASIPDKSGPRSAGGCRNATKSLTVPLALTAMAERQGSYQTGSRVRVGAVPPPVPVLMRTASAGSRLACSRGEQAVAVFAGPLGP